MKTVTIQIGNSDDKLTQQRWADYVFNIATMVASHEVETHFFACAHGAEKWQNAAWVVVGTTEELAILQDSVREIRKMYDQDSVAWTEGETQFV